MIIAPDPDEEECWWFADDGTEPDPAAAFKEELRRRRAWLDEHRPGWRDVVEAAEAEATRLIAERYPGGFMASLAKAIAAAARPPDDPDPEDQSPGGPRKSRKRK